MSRYSFIEAQRADYPVRLLSASGYYALQHAQQQEVEQCEPAWKTALVKVFGRHKRRYGTRRLQVALHSKGYRIGRQRLRSAMRRQGLEVRATAARAGVLHAKTKLFIIYALNTSLPINPVEWPGYR